MHDMTEGKLFPHLLKYAVPLLLANWLQLAYNACDSMIAGRFLGQDALAAEGIAAPVMNFVILAVSGLCIGAGVFMSECFGRKDMSALRRSLAAILKAGVSAGCLIGAAGFIASPWILQAMAVPRDIFDIACTYLKITFIGVPFTFAWNALSTAVKSIGDSKTPLRILAVCSVLNIVLDLILLGIFGCGIAVSAVTTVAAEAFSCLLIVHALTQRMPELIPDASERVTDRALLREVMKYGLPAAFQQAVQPIGKILIQSRVNMLGVSVIAAFNAVSRIDSFALIPEQGIASAISTCVAQNRGAKKPERVRAGFRAGIAMEICYGAMIGILALTAGRAAVSLFVSGEGKADVVTEGSAYLAVMAFLYVLPGLTNGFQGYCRGAGRIPVTIFCTFIQISLRTAGTYLLAEKTGIRGIAMASGIGWLCMLVFEIPYVLHHMRTLSEENI